MHDEAGNPTPSQDHHSTQECQAQVTLVNELGLHARAAGKLVATATAYEAEVWVQKGGKRVNAKSIMGILMLAASQGSQLTILTRGESAQAACEALEQLIKEGFGEHK